MGDETALAQSGQVYNDEVDVLELLRVLWRRKFFLIAACVLGLAVAGGYFASTPKTYTATRTMILDLPSEQDMLLLAPRFYAREMDGRMTLRVSSVANRVIILDSLANYRHQYPGIESIYGEFSNSDVNVLIRIQGRNLEAIGEAFAGLPEYLKNDERITHWLSQFRSGLERKLEADAGLLAQYETLLGTAQAAGNAAVIGFDVFRAIRDVQQDMAERRERLDALDASNLIEYVDDEFIITDVRPRVGLILVMSLVGGLLFAVLGALLFEAYARKTDT